MAILVFTMILLTYFLYNPLLLFLQKLSIFKRNVFCSVAITSGMEVAQNYWFYGEPVWFDFFSFLEGL